MLAFATAFRAFFLLAALLAAMWVPAWTFLSTGNGELSTNLGAMGWHAHEMVFGYVGAVLAGFLLTSTRVWTGRLTLAGPGLGVLVLVWCAGRVAVLQTGALPALAPPLIDGLFFAIVAVAIGWPIAAARSWRNAGFPVLLLVIGACDVAVHLHVLGRLPPWSSRALDVALDAIALIIIIFAGRIIPLFTKNATGVSVRSRGAVDTLGLLAMVVLLAMRAAAPEHAAAHLIAVTAGVINAGRLIGWAGTASLRRPIVWVLHLGWLLLSAGIALSGLARLLTFAPPGSFIHLVTIGGVGLLTLAMMSRVSLGHTGRPLEVSRLIAAGYVLVVVAAAARVAAQMVSPALYADLLWVASAAWSLGFLAFLARYAPILLSARVDGKPG